MPYVKKIALSVSVLCLSAGLAQADQVFVDDVIVNGGSLCVGLDCVNGESFGFDTLRLKENNLRIHFQDTSNSASFPTTDWRLTANDSTNGGQNRFSIEDATASRVPFTVEGGAPSHSLYVDDGGRIGVGKSTPVVEMHIADGDSPTVRLEQDGTSGFTPQTWDMAGNETNFFVRDVTNGSRLPFRIEPSTPSNSLYLDSTGNVGFGTTAPLRQVHVSGDGNNRRSVRLEQTTANEKWDLSIYETTATEGAGNFGINEIGGGARLILEANTGDVILPTLPNCASGLKTDADGRLSCL